MNLHPTLLEDFNWLYYQIQIFNIVCKRHISVRTNICNVCFLSPDDEFSVLGIGFSYLLIDIDSIFRNLCVQLLVDKCVCVCFPTLYMYVKADLVSKQMAMNRL